MEERDLRDGEIFMKLGTPGPSLTHHPEILKKKNKKRCFCPILTGRPVSAFEGTQEEHILRGGGATQLRLMFGYFSEMGRG